MVHILQTSLVMRYREKRAKSEVKEYMFKAKWTFIILFYALTSYQWVENCIRWQAQEINYDEEARNSDEPFFRERWTVRKMQLAVYITE